MGSSVLLIICGLLLLAYVFDISSSRTRIPSVILLLLLGWGMQQITLLLDIRVPDMEPALPALGTIGLILIVLDGTLEIDLDRSKFPLISKSAIMAFLPLLLMSLILGYAFSFFGGVSFKTGVTNAIPFGVISSAIAIPTVRHLIAPQREFITYDSCLSDVFGVIFFNFVALNESIGWAAVGSFVMEMILVIIVSFVATLLLSYLLNHLRHHVKFTPIILMIVFIYIISKEIHLPALLFVMLFGIFLGNVDKLSNYNVIKKMHPGALSREVRKFKELVVELTFLIRAVFFMLFGFFIKTEEILNTNSLMWAIGITVGIFLLRGVLLKFLKTPLTPILFVAPRGLISILLFLSVPASAVMPFANRSLIVQVIIFTALIMMFGMIKAGNGQSQKTGSR
jgi:Kef-type K+ transport system membrane component KefB